MQLSEIQYLLNRIYLETSLRESFFHDRIVFLQQHKITCPETISFFTEIKKEQIEFYSESLYTKRIHAVNSLLPFTVKFLGKEHKALFRMFADSFQPSGIHKHHLDALSYCEYLKQKVVFDFPLRSAVNFEKERLRLFLGNKPFAMSIFHFDPQVFLREDLNLVDKKDLQRKTLSFVIWKKARISKIVRF